MCNLITNYIIKGDKSKGYARVSLKYANGISKHKLVHALVASAFLEVYEGMNIDYINPNKDDNTIWNLR